MKMKFFTLILSAMFTMSVQAQDFADYSSVVGQSYNQLSHEYADLEELFEGFYSCNPQDGKTESLTIAFNDDLEAYTVMQSLLEDAYTLEQIIAYMDGKYTKYDPETSEYTDEETGEVISSTTYRYGNTAAMDDATLLITFSDNSMVAYINPKAAPAVPENAGIGEITPIEAADSFVGKELVDILDEYPGMFTEMMGMYAAWASEDDLNEYLEGIALLPDDNGVVASVRLLFAATDDTVVEYYKENGYTVTENGTTDEGETIYLITNGTYSISLAGGSGLVTADGSTGISTVKKAETDAAWYSIAGHRQNGKPAKKGLYIRDGRKVIIK